VKDYEITRLRDYEITRLRDYEIKKNVTYCLSIGYVFFTGFNAIFYVEIYFRYSEGAPQYFFDFQLLNNGGIIS
jgi:hypothetical protein